MSDTSDLGRFILAQETNGSYATARSEIRDGEKRSHWIWYVFPQIVGLGFSGVSHTYAIADLDEARAYLAHPVLGQRLREITSPTSTSPRAPAPSSLMTMSSSTPA